MRKLAVRLGIAALACMVGIGTSTVWSNEQSSSPDRRCKDLVTVKQQNDAPARISILQTCCDRDFVDVTFEVQSLNGRAITSYEVWVIRKVDGRPDTYHRSVIVQKTGKDPDNQPVGLGTNSNTIGVPLNRGFLRSRIDNVSLYIGSVEFSEGTGWHERIGCGFRDYGFGARWRWLL